jgi:tetratricopeptide (TPR) repeat protein
MGNSKAAEPLFVRSLLIDEKGLPSDSPDLASDLQNLAMLYYLTRRPEQAVPLYHRALDIRTRVLGANDPDTLTTARGYAMTLRLLGRNAEAQELDMKIKASEIKGKAGSN